MKILAIRINNLASLEGDTVIDFTEEPLKSAVIFAITGRTGAGKSTILDALCLALYGKTPRYIQAKEMGIDIIDVKGSTISQGDVRGILRDGTGEGMAQVDFIAISDDVYRATWQVRRARNKADGNIQADTIQLYNISKNEEIPGRKSEIYPEIERLVGLNFEQFTRSVLLAQGDFTAFLKAGKDEKSALLEKLTGTHIYSEISRRIYERHKQEEQNLRELNFRKDGISVMAEEEVNDLINESLLLVENINAKTNEVDSLAKEINWHEHSRNLRLKCDSADLALKKNLSFQEETKNRKHQLSIIEKVEKYRKWFEDDTRLQKQLLQSENALQLIEINIDDYLKQKGDLDAQLSHTDASLQAKKLEYTELLPVLEEMRKIDTQLNEKDLRLIKSLKELEFVSKKYSDCETDFKKAREDSDLISTEIKNIENWQLNNKDRQALVDNLNLILSKLNDAAQLLENKRITEEDLKIIQEKILVRAAEKVDLEKQLTKDRESLERVLQLNEKLRISLNETPIDQFRKEKGILEEEISELIEAKAFWSTLCVSLLNHDNLLKNQENDRSKLIQKEALIVELGQNLKEAEVRKQSSTEILDKARLAASENVEALRARLVANEPCPVCGSVEHPYKNANPHVEGVLVELEKIKSENEAAYFGLFKKVNNLELECRNLNEAIGKREKENNQIGSELKEKWTKWEGFSVSNLCKEINIDERETWLANRISEGKSKLSVLQNEITLYETQKQSLETEQIGQETLKLSVDILNNELKDVIRNQHILKEQEGGLNKSYNQFTTSIEEIRIGLGVFFSVSDWMEKWKKAPDSFVKQLEDFTNQWKAKKEKLESYNHQVNTLKASLAQMEKQIIILNEELAVKKNDHSIENAEFLKLKERRDHFLMENQ